MLIQILCISVLVGLATMGISTVVERLKKPIKNEEEELFFSLLEVEKALTDSLLRFQQQRLHLLSQIERLEEKGGNTTLIAQYKSDGVSLTERVTQICEALFALWRTRMFAYFRWEHSSLLQKLPVLPSFTELEGEAVYKKSYVELVDFTHEIRRVLEGVQQKSLFPPEHLKIPQYIQDEVQEEKEGL